MSTRSTEERSVASPPAGVDWKQEALSGATIFAVLVPSALAYSSIVGVTPIVGLVGVPLALIAYAVFGGSSVVVVGSDAAVSVLVASTVATVAPTEEQYLTAVLAVSLLVGVIFLLFRLARLGWIADIVPQPVLKGFVQGLVWTTIIGQVPKLLGMQVGKSHTNMFAQIVELGRSGSSIDVPTAITGVAALAALLAITRFKRSWPGALMVLVGSGIVYALFKLGDDGVTAVGVPTGSLINTSLSLPDKLGSWSGMIPGAAAIVVLAFTEHLGAVQMVADARGERVDPNQELLGLGAANLAVGVGSSYAVTGALSKTSVAIETGARTKWANVITAAMAVVAAIALRPMFGYLANTVLAAIVVWAMLGMIDTEYMRWLWKVSRLEFGVGSVAFFGVMILGVMPAVILATVLSLGVLGRRIGRPETIELGRTPQGVWRRLDRHHDAQRVDGFRVFRFEGPVVFLNARVLADRMRNAEQPGVVVIFDGSAVSTIDTTGQRYLASALRSVRDDGEEFRFAGVDDVVWAQLQRAVAVGGTDPGPMYLTIDDAVDDHPADVGA